MYCSFGLNSYQILWSFCLLKKRCERWRSVQSKIHTIDIIVWNVCHDHKMYAMVQIHTLDIIVWNVLQLQIYDHGIHFIGFCVVLMLFHNGQKMNSSLFLSLDFQRECFSPYNTCYDHPQLDPKHRLLWCIFQILCNCLSLVRFIVQLNL